MKKSLPFLFVAAALVAAAAVWLRAEREAEAAVRAPEPAVSRAPLAAPAERASRVVPVPVPAAADPVESTTSPPGRSAPAPDEPLPRAGGPSTAAEAIAVAAAASRLGWAVADPRSATVARWVAAKREAQQPLYDGLASGGRDRGAPDPFAAIDADSEARRAELVTALGVDGAQAVYDAYPQYRFDSDGSWYRVDARGEKVPFVHPDEQLWVRGERAHDGEEDVGIVRR